jgi:hypothetical protein
LKPVVALAKVASLLKFTPLAKKGSFMLRLLLVLMLLFASPVRAGFDSGNSLHNACSGSEGEYGKAYCMGYSVGVADIMVYTTLDGWKACIPEGATRGQVMDIVTRWLANNPQKRHYNASGLVAQALEEAFPC